MSKETNTVQSFQPEVWDEEKFLKELGDLIEQDVRMRLSAEVSKNPRFSEMLKETFNMYDLNNPIREACLRSVKDEGITFEELYYRIKIGMVFK